MIEITDETNHFIRELNEELEENCSDNLRVTLERHITDWKLCLLHYHICVSDLRISDNKGYFNILSTTLIKHQGKGYNKFLTAVSICLADTMTKCKELFSSTSHPARIAILKKYNHTLEVDEKTGSSNFFVPINKENQDKAQKIIDDWIGNNCEKKNANVRSGGKNIRRNTQRRKSKKHKTKRLYK